MVSELIQGTLGQLHRLSGVYLEISESFRGYQKFTLVFQEVYRTCQRVSEHARGVSGGIKAFQGGRGFLGISGTFKGNTSRSHGVSVGLWGVSGYLRGFSPLMVN